MPSAELLALLEKDLQAALKRLQQLRDQDEPARISLADEPTRSSSGAQFAEPGDLLMGHRASTGCSSSSYMQLAQAWARDPDADVDASITALQFRKHNNWMLKASISRKLIIPVPGRGIPLLSPSSAINFAVDIGGVLCFLADIVLGPVQVFYTERESSNSAFANIADITPLLTAVFWTLTLPLGFVTSFYDSHGNLELRPRVVATSYLRTWFLHDLALVVLDWMAITSLMLDSSALRALRFLRVLRAVRVNRATAQVTQRLAGRDSLLIGLRIVKYFLTMLLLAHLVACAWYAIGLYEDDGFQWVDVYAVRERSVHYRIYSSWHWALAQFGPTKVSHVPTNRLETAFAVGVASVAMVVNPFIVSRITSSMVALENLQQQRQLQASQLSKYLHRHGVSAELQHRIRSAQESAVCDSDSVPELLMMLPVDLTVALNIQILFPVVQKHALLRTVVSGNGNAAEITLASTGLQDRLLSGGQKLFVVGQHAQHMHFVLRGQISYQLKRADADQRGSVHTKTSTVTTWLSEQALWLHKWLHLGVAVTFQGDSVEILSLGAEIFQSVFHDWRALKRYAACYVDAMQEGHHLHTDIGDDEWTADVVQSWSQSALASHFDSSFCSTPSETPRSSVRDNSDVLATSQTRASKLAERLQAGSNSGFPEVMQARAGDPSHDRAVPSRVSVVEGEPEAALLAEKDLVLSNPRDCCATLESLTPHADDLLSTSLEACCSTVAMESARQRKAAQ